ncbi:MAG: DUF962 domain-containing protein, partial [Candidatus Eremiobacteraeota bacterium]|nr:DUF962 domain-containing protein [Candidatus Eremiobacteraeota bacterium]
MASDSSLFEDYGAYHRDRRNLICHEIGIPLIVLAIIALLRLIPGEIPVLHLTVAGLLLLATIMYYIVAFSKLGARRAGTRTRTWPFWPAYIASAGLMVLYLVAGYVTWPLAIGLFVVGWVFQFVGHYFEGKSPAFLTNLLHLLVGPVWVASHL